MKSNHLLVVVFALLAVLIVILVTKFGIGITPDSTVYIEAARNLLNGRGLIALTAKGELGPMTHYPPLYSSLLALIGLTQITIEVAARWLQAILLGANVLMVGLTIARYARDSFWLPIVGALLMLTAPDVLSIHALVLTEPLFILLAVSCLVTLARFLETDRWWFLLIAAALAALAVLTRYVGAAVIITGLIALLLVGKHDWRKRFGSAIVFGAVACAPILMWMLRNSRLTGGPTDRQMVIHSPGLKQIVVAMSTLSSWLLLGKVRGDLRVGFFIAEVVMAAFFVLYLLKESRQSSGGSVSAGITHHPGPDVAKLSLVLVIFIISYVGFLVITATLFDIVMFDERTLVPVHVVSIILVIGLVARLLPRVQTRRAIRLAFSLMALALLDSYTLRAANWFTQTRPDGQYYAGSIWKDSNTIARLRSLPPNIPIYSNGYDAIYYLTGRPAVLIPAKTVFVTGQPNQDYEAELERMRRALRDQRGVLVYFNTLPERWFLPTESELKTRLSLTEIAKSSDGSIWQVRPKPARSDLRFQIPDSDSRFGKDKVLPDIHSTNDW